jgi:single-strand DNA-binding protein
VAFLARANGSKIASSSPGGTQLRVAVNQRRQRPDGEPEETTTWFGVRAMGPLGERCATLDKGTRVLVIGRLDIRSYQRQDGTPAVAYDVWADEVLNMSPRAEADGGAEAAPPSAARPPAAPSQPAGPAASEEDLENLPF